VKAVRIQEPGGPEVLRLEDVPEPTPAAGEALVKIEAAGVNYVDVYCRTGLYPYPLPGILGVEAAGTVVAVGPGVIDPRPGERVAYTNVPGSYAEMSVVPVERLVKLPEGVTARQGAAAMLQGMTAHYLATATYPLRAGDTCMIHAAAGGVGLLFCQIAKMRDATVIGTTSSAEKAALARAAGADHVILYSEQDFAAEARRLTGGTGVHVVYDGVGASTFAQGLDCLRPRGMMVLFGQASGPVPPFDLSLLNLKGSLYVTRPSLNAYVASRAELLARATDVLGWIATGTLRLRIEHEFPLAEAAAAHRALESRRTTGKLLLIP
jgi:NADPH2:quinone reductase